MPLELLVLTYRHIHLLSSLFNDLQQKFFLPAMMQSASVVLAFGIAMLVILPIRRDLVLIEFLLAGSSIDSILFLLFCLGGMVTVHNQSCIALRKLRNKVCITTDKSERKLVRLLIRSFCPIKIKFGANNFVEALTPFKCLHYVMRFTVQILLLQRRGGEA